MSIQSLSTIINNIHSHATSIEQALDELNTIDIDNFLLVEVEDITAFKNYLRRILSNIVVEEKKLSDLVDYHYKVIYNKEYGDPLELLNWLDHILKTENLVVVATVGDYFIFADKEGRNRPSDPAY
ncbi:MAG: hypothetical protein WC479_04540 [Candidatus Izemoplasmatales bacterium]|jgi:hypothetical protein